MTVIETSDFNIKFIFDKEKQMFKLEISSESLGQSMRTWLRLSEVRKIKDYLNEWFGVQGT